MTTNPDFVEVEVEKNISFVLPSYHSLPISALMPVLVAPPHIQVPVIISMVRELVATDRQEEFDSLNLIQTEKLIMTWMSMTAPKLDLTKQKTKDKNIFVKFFKRFFSK
jgi:hypothetical protein